MAQPKEKEKQNNDNCREMFEKYEQRINKFENEICEFPVDNNRIIADDWKDLRSEIYGHMQSCYPLVHGSVISLAHDFLLRKRKHGSDIEKALYMNMKLCDFFDRLATKKCVVFYQSYDSYLLRNGYNDSGKWEYIGTAHEEKVDKYEVSPQRKAKLAQYLSYDELLLSALCGISSPTHFINNGERRNCGRRTFEEPTSAIYMGLVGARFEKARFMEYSLMVITADQNTKQNGYGEQKDSEQSIFEKFYKSKSVLYSDINNDETKYYKKEGWGGSVYFDCAMFRQRIRVSLELFLFDADKRGKEAQRSVYCHVVGLGTGVWAFKKSIQDEIIVRCTRDIVATTQLSSIECVYFSWMDPDCTKDIDFNSNDGPIVFDCGKRAPADPLPKRFEHCLIVAMYAWDSNSFPGNEYYHGMLSASGDPAAASCSTISFVQNSEINKEFINGANTTVYFYNAQQKTYEFYKMKDLDFENNTEKWLTKSADTNRN